MTSQTDFTSDEWETILEAPPSAGLTVIMAQRGGTFRETMSMAKSYAAAQKQPGESQLIDEIVAHKPQIDHKRFHTYEEMRDHSLSKIGDAIGVLNAKATPDEVQDYREFVTALATSAAEAHREDGVEISAAEQAAIDAISGALNGGT